MLDRESSRLKVNGEWEEALVVLAVNFYLSVLERDPKIRKLVVSHFEEAGVCYTEEDVMEALEELCINNNEYHVLGVPDPYDEEPEEVK